jgi:hypothetical protein
MPLSLDQIKLLNSVDLDNFAIRGAKSGVNNAKSTGPLYDAGKYIPLRTIIYGDATVSATDNTVTGVSFRSPYAFFDSSDLVIGDTLIVNSDNTLTVGSIISPTSFTVTSNPTLSGWYDTTVRLKDRDYLIEPDIENNTINTGLAKFVQNSVQVEGSGTDWSSSLRSGDTIQLNTYQKYFIIDTVVSDTSCLLIAAFDASSSGFAAYTAKKWRLGRLKYRYVKQYFNYDDQKAKWVYDSTTGDNFTATSDFIPFVDGINLKFSPALSPSLYPDLMDSNIALNKILTRSTTNDMLQYPLSVVPNPEESFQLYINDLLKDRFPSGNGDYVISYSQMPYYVYPPPMSQRTVANLMFLKKVQSIALSPTSTSEGILNFTDGSGNAVSGIMPGSETIYVDGTYQTPNENYVIDLDSGQAFASEFKTNESLVKYIAYQRNDLFDYGFSVTKDGTPQTITIPGKETDDILFDYESGRLKPVDKDNPGPGEEYRVNYYTEGEYITNETHLVPIDSTYIRVDSYPIKFQSVILSKDGTFLDEGIDYRVSCLTGRIVFFNQLTASSTIVVSYSPLDFHSNGLTYENGQNYCTVYDSTTSVASVSPIEVVFTNPSIDASDVSILSVYNVSKASYYNTSGSVIVGNNVQLVSDGTNLSIGTELSDTIILSYKFPYDGVEFAPVETIKLFVGQNTNYMVLVNRDATSLFTQGTFIRLTNVDSAGDFYFQDSSSIYDGEDTVVYFTGSAPSDINNPGLFLSDADNFTFNSITAPLGIVSGSTDVVFPGVDISRTFRPGKLMMLGDDFYYVRGASYDSSTGNTTATLGVQTIIDYTDSTILSNVTLLDVPLYFEGDTVISTEDAIITDPAAPVMTITYDGYATITKDSSAFSVDIGSQHYTFLDASYPQIYHLAMGLASLDFTCNVNASNWYTNKIIPFSNLVVTSNSNTVVTSNPALRLNYFDTTDFTITGGILTLNNLLGVGQRYDMDYLGLRTLGDSTVVFSGSYFTNLLAGSKVSASLKYDNVDQFYIQVMGERTFLTEVIKPAAQEEAAQQNGNVGQGGDIPTDSGGTNDSGGIAGDEFRRVDKAITCEIFDKIFDYFNNRLKYFSDEYLAISGLKLCNNDGLLSETDQSAGSLSINRMFPWADYTNFDPAYIACLTGQSIPYASMGPSGPKM